MGNKEQLKEPGILFPNLSDSGIVIPRTIRDAQALILTLISRFLRVDSLSVVQDGLNISLYLNAIALICANAQLTIMVANGISANSGILGLARHVNPETSVATFSDSLVCISL